MALASFALAALREVSDRLCAPAGLPKLCGLPHAIDNLLVHGEQPSVDPPIARRAVRHAWLTLEIALAGTPVHEQISTLFSARQAPLFHEQIEILLDLLGRAGLDYDDPEVCREHIRELRSARQTSFPVVAEPVHAECEDIAHCNGAIKGSDNGQPDPLALIAENLQRTGYPNLARVVELRSLWDEPLFVGIVVFFLRRSTGIMPEGTPDSLAKCEESWCCLEMTADLLDRREDEVAALLDRSENTGDALTQDGTDARAAAALYQLGTSCCRRGDYRKAVTHFTAALKLDPTNSLIYHQRGESYLLLCRYQRAIADFQVAVRLSPEAPAILASRAIAYHQSGEHDRAIADCTAALALDPNHTEAYSTRARAAAEMGRHADAISDLTRVIGLAVDDDEAHYLRGLSHARLEDFTAAVADFNRTLELNRHHVPAWLYRGHAHRRLGDQAKAIRDYTEVLHRHPGNALAHSGRGLAHKKQGNQARALADFTEALRLGSNNPLDYYHRASLYRESGDLARAGADLDDAIRLQPELWPALYCRGKILFAQGQYSLAVLDLTEVVRLNPTHVAGYLSRALAYDRLGHYSEGAADADRAIQLEPGSPAAHLVRGVLHAHQGNRAAALADQTETIRLDERLGLAYHERSMTYTLQGDYDRALSDCNQFVALEPGNAQAYATRSIVYHFKGDVAQAVTDYVRALQIDPKRLMMGWNEPPAENAHRQAAQLIADYIDGLRHEHSAPEPSLSEFHIVIKPAGGRDGSAATVPPRTTPRKPVKKTDLVKPQAPTTETTGAAVQPTLPAVPVADVPQGETVQVESSPIHELGETFAHGAIGERRGVSPPVRPLTGGLTPRRSPNRAPSPGMSTSPAERFLPDADTIRLAPVEELVSETPAKPRNEAEEAHGKSAPSLVTCVNCSRQTTPIPVSEGRIRCEHCKSVFPLGTVRKPSVSKKAPRPPFLETYKRPLSITAGVAAALILLVVLGPKLFGNGRVRVYRAGGKADFEGKPMAKATIILHPVEARSVPFPLPCATVQEDGTFILGTYRKGDGAPEGEYKVTVQWVVATPRNRFPTNVLPPKYSDAQSSDLTVRIKSGSNALPPFQFTRAGKR
jgi:tetratricopeptide (TPR) repeat protein